MTGHYFDEEPDVDSDIKKVAASIAGTDYIFETDRGVFSYEKLDKATRVLLEVFNDKAEIANPKTIVDLGCGYGAIACAMATKFDSAKIIAVDVNVRARDLAKRNLQANNPNSNFQVVSPNEVDSEVEPDLIISNPPIRIGKKEVIELLKTWIGRLSNNGEMWLVIAKNLGADSIAQRLSDDLKVDVERKASKKGFRVLKITSPKA